MIAPPTVARAMESSKQTAWLSRAFGGFLAILNGIASLWVLVLVGLISADVILRVALNAPLPGVPEVVRFSIVGMVWLQMAYTLRVGRQLRTTIGLALLPSKARSVVLVLNSLAGAAMLCFVAWLGWTELVESWEIGAFEGEEPVRIPVWPLWAVLVAGAAFTAIQYVLNAVRCVREGPAVEAEQAGDTLE